MERMCLHYNTKSGKNLFIDKNYINKKLTIYDRDNNIEIKLTEKERKEINNFLDNLKRTDLVRTYFC